jgi:hypothetical protein
MQEKDSLSMSSKELLIRIDERQRTMNQDIVEIKTVLASKVQDDEEYKEMKEKVNVLWDANSRVKGYIGLVGIFFGIISALMVKFLDRFLFPK